MWEWLKDITGKEKDSELDAMWDSAQEQTRGAGCLLGGEGFDMLYARRDAVKYEREV